MQCFPWLFYFGLRMEKTLWSGTQFWGRLFPYLLRFFSPYQPRFLYKCLSENPSVLLLHCFCVLYWVRFSEKDRAPKLYSYCKPVFKYNAVLLNLFFFSSFVLVSWFPPQIMVVYVLPYDWWEWCAIYLANGSAVRIVNVVCSPLLEKDFSC